MGVKRCRKVRPFLPFRYACMKMHATHYIIYTLQLCYLKDVCKGRQTGRNTQESKGEYSVNEENIIPLFPS